MVGIQSPFQGSLSKVLNYQYFLGLLFEKVKQIDGDSPSDHEEIVAFGLVGRLCLG